MSDQLDSAPTTELGYAVARSAAPGFLHDPAEPAPELKWPDSIAVYDRMRRSEGTIATIWRSVHLATGRLRFLLDPNGAEDETVELTAEDIGVPILGAEEHVATGRTRDRFQFRDHRRLAYLAPIYGAMPFEQVGRVEEDPRTPSGYAWRLRKLAERMPSTIANWDVERDGGLNKIEQWPSGYDGPRNTAKPKRIEIPRSRLIVYSYDKEGGNWTGISILRPSHKFWVIKDRILRVLVVADDRTGMGIPWLESREGAKQEQIDKLAAVAQAIRAGESAGGAGPGRLRLAGVEGSLPDLIDHVRYMDQQMSMTTMSQFLLLGQNAVGSRALADSFLDFFGASVHALAQDFAETFNAHMIEDMVDWNFGGDYGAPRLVVLPPEEDQVLTPDELQALAEVGAIDPRDPHMRGYVRERYGLPEPEEPPEGGATVATGRPVRVRTAGERRTIDHPTPTPKTRPALPTIAAAPFRHPKPDVSLLAAPLRPVRRILDLAGSVARRVVGAAQADIRTWRVLAQAERDAGFDPDRARSDHEAALALLLAAWQSHLDGWDSELVAQLGAAGGLDDLLALTVSVTDAERATIAAGMEAAAALGAQQATDEAAHQGVDVGAFTTPDEGRFGTRAATVAGMLAAGRVMSARNRAVTEAGDRTWDARRVADAVAAHLAGLAGQYDRDQLGGAVQDGIAAGRFAVMEAAPTAAAYRAVELLDPQACDPCRDIDGTEFATLAEAREFYPSGLYRDCLGGVRCRGVVLALWE